MGMIWSIVLCCVAVFIGMVHLVVSFFWQKKWFAFLPILSYLCLVPFVVECFIEVARRSEAGDLSTLQDIYPGIGNGLLLCVAAVTALHVLALILKGRGDPHNQ